MIEFGPSMGLAATVFIALLIAVAFGAYKIGYSEGAEAGRAYERKYGEKGVDLSLGEDRERD